MFEIHCVVVFSWVEVCVCVCVCVCVPKTSSEYVAVDWRLISEEEEW